MARKTIVVQMTEGTTIIMPDIVWDLIKDHFQEMLDVAYDCIEEYEKEKAGKDVAENN